MSGGGRGERLVSAGAGVAAGLLAYATLIEPYALRVERVTVRGARLPAAFHGCRVLLLSDFHARGLGAREELVLDTVARLPRHDIVALCGDLIYTPRGMDGLAEFVRRLPPAPGGVYATYGNSEHKNGVVPHRFAERLAAAGATMLLNSHRVVRRDGEGSGGEGEIVVAGVDDPVTGHDDLAAALAGAPADRFHLLLMHSPDSVGLACARGIDLVLSGHTHGGQIKLPLVGAPFTHSDFGRAMSHGLYGGARLRRVIGQEPGRTQLYVSRGIGISGLALRFLCRPEITSITLLKG